MSSNVNEIRQSMMRLYLSELKALNIKIERKTDYSIKFRLGTMVVNVYPYNEDIYHGNKLGNGLDYMLELIMCNKSWKEQDYKRRLKERRKIASNVGKPDVPQSTKPPKHCPNMAEYEALLNELGIYYDKLPQELIIMFEGYPVKIFPRRHWFTGRKVKDGRGIDNLRRQLTRFNL
jgi:hypothetical protein